ncbi:MAG: hypothetical protein IPJ66_15025 [Bacteroidetes bacterium]|nr:hypothetical protein [Bacteroidota bacterium]
MKNTVLVMPSPNTDFLIFTLQQTPSAVPISFQTMAQQRFPTDSLPIFIMRKKNGISFSDFALMNTMENISVK